MEDTNNARELRKQRILQNAQNRLDLLKGIQTSSDDLNAVKLTRLAGDSVCASSGTMNNGDLFPRKRSDGDAAAAATAATVVDSGVSQNSEEKVLLTPNNKPFVKTKINGVNNVRAKTPGQQQKLSGKCKFNGYSNNEIFIFFTLALAMSILIAFDYSHLMSHNVLLPFFTFEVIHGVAHFRHIPSTSSQFQMFSILLRLCGISANSLNNLMTVFNFLFILIDNFIIYIFSFVFINILLTNLVL